MGAVGERRLGSKCNRVLAFSPVSKAFEAGTEIKRTYYVYIYRYEYIGSVSSHTCVALSEHKSPLKLLVANMGLRIYKGIDYCSIGYILFRKTYFLLKLKEYL